MYDLFVIGLLWSNVQMLVMLDKVPLQDRIALFS